MRLGAAVNELALSATFRLRVALESPKTGRPDPDRDFQTFQSNLERQIPFTFVRFSDGEMEIIRNERLEISETTVRWRKGEVSHKYPTFDAKLFEPGLHQKLRGDLIVAAKYRAAGYYKGVVTRHNDAVADRDLMISLNGTSLDGLTFTDLFLNSNYRSFLKVIAPLFQQFYPVYIIGNYRMQPSLMNTHWHLIAVPDNFFLSYDETLDRVWKAVRDLPPGALVLSAASSLTNIVGHRLHQRRPDITFLDIGTSLHSHMGLQGSIREYHAHAERWTFRNALRKFYLKNKRDYRLVW